MSWLPKNSTRLGLGSPEASPATDFLVSFDGNDVSAHMPVRGNTPRSGELLPGDRVFGDYEIQRLLGAGGFGEVYLAEMQQEGTPGLYMVMPGVPVALKRVRAADPRLVKALREELRTFSELPQHPNLLRYRFFRISGDDLYIASEYAKGGSLVDRIGAKPLPLSLIIDLGLQMVWGLAALHEAGFLHGDLKPSNVLLNENGVTARLCDYGLSHRIGKTPGIWSVPRGHTPEFASPEQVRGDDMNVATDIWSLGALLLSAAVPEARWSDWRSLRSGSHGWVKKLPTALGNVIIANLKDEPAARASLDDVEASLRDAWKQVSGTAFNRARPQAIQAPRRELSKDWYDARSIALRCTDPLYEELEAEEAKDSPDKDRVERLEKILFEVSPQDMTAISPSAGRTSAAQDVKIFEMLEGACAVYRGLIREGRVDLVEDLAHAARSLLDFHHRRGDLRAASEVAARFADSDVPAATTDPALLSSRYSALREAAVSLNRDGRPRDALAIINSATKELGACLWSVPSEDAVREELHRLQFTMLTDRGVVLLTAKEHSDALKAFDQALAFDAEVKAKGFDDDLIGPRFFANALCQRANVQDCLGHGRLAVPDYERAIVLLEGARKTSAVTEELESTRLNLAVTLTRLGAAARAVPLLESVVTARAARLAPSAEDVDFEFKLTRSLSEDWEPRHRLAFAHFSLANALHRSGQLKLAMKSAGQAYAIWKRLVEEDGHSQFRQYQEQAMFQTVRISLDDH